MSLENDVGIVSVAGSKSLAGAYAENLVVVSHGYQFRFLNQHEPVLIRGCSFAHQCTLPQRNREVSVVGCEFLDPLVDTFRLHGDPIREIVTLRQFHNLWREPPFQERYINSYANDLICPENQGTCT